jgi:YVTN family beta-propeller protein
MEFRILGPLEVLDGERPVQLGGPRQRSLLAILALHANEIVSRDRLIDELWHESPPETAQTAVHVHVSQLRKALGADRIETRAPGYVLRVEVDELDVERFERLVEESRSASPAVAAERLRAALSTWRGAPLADLDGDLARPDRAHLEEKRMAAVELRIAADLDLGGHDALVPELDGLVREHPLRERLRGQLMVALYRSGRQAAALEVYRDGRRLLDAELGLEPGDELKRLERAILEQDPSLAAKPAPGTRAGDAVPTGTVTFVFSDIEGSTRLVGELGDEYGALLEQHNRLLREAFEQRGGQEIHRQGDAFFFAFRRARDAVRAAVDAQRALSSADWGHGRAVRVRIGIHTGEPGLADGGYHGLDVVRAARISGSAHGGQILVSGATRALVDSAVADVEFEDLGDHPLRDIEQLQRIFQVVVPGLTCAFPPLRVEEAARVMTIGGREEELAAAAESALVTEERRVRLFRRSRLSALAGALLLAGAAAGLGVALTSGSGGSVVVAPNSVAVVDPETSRLVGDVPVGLRPIAVAVGEGAVWVANADDGTVQRIDPETRKVVATIGLGGEVSDLAVGSGSVWVAGGNDETLTRIDPRENAVEARLTFGTFDPLDPQPMFVVATGAGAVWVTRGNRVLRIDPTSNEVTATVPVDRPVALAVGAGAVWVTGYSERILRIEPRTGDVTATIPVPAQAWGLAAGNDAFWAVVGIGGGEIWRFDPDTGSTTATIRTGEGPIDLAPDGEMLWTANLGHGGSMRRIDATGRGGGETVLLGQLPTALATGERTVWVAVASPAS